ncbi:unnamed protein product, partial [Rotaria magnacalcarata]
TMTLSRLVAALLSIPVSSATSERIFSETGRILEARRQQLSAESLDSLVFLPCIYGYNYQYHGNINKVSILLYIFPMSYRREGLPYIDVKLAKATLVPIALQLQTEQHKIEFQTIQ